MRTIVIADDDVIFLHGLLQHVPWNNLGLSVVGTAENGKMLLDLCKQKQPDILLTDVRMPYMTGIESAMEIHEALPNCLIIFMSAVAQPADYRSAIKLGVLDFLEKPIEMEEISQALRDAVSQLDKHTPVMEESANPSRIICEVMQYIRKNYMKELTVELLSQLVFFSPNYLSMLFHKENGVTITQYLTRCRLEAARQLLHETRKSIEEISIEVGYHDVRHFSKMFRRSFSMTPSDFRREAD